MALVLLFVLQGELHLRKIYYITAEVEELS